MHVIILACDPQLGAVVKDYFDRRLIRSSEVVLAGEPTAVQWMLDTCRPSAVLVVGRRPDDSTMKVCRAVASRADVASVPFVAALVEADETARIAILDAGADAVMPFELDAIEWQIRVVCERTIVHRQRRGQDSILQMGHSSVPVAGQSVVLTVTEAAILRALLHQRNQVVSRGYLEHWLGKRTASRTLTVHVVRLRRKLGALGQRIETVRRVGYRYAEPRDEQSKKMSTMG